jgi:hypothetical protein
MCAPPNKGWRFTDPKGEEFTLCSLRCLAIWAVQAALNPRIVARDDAPAEIVPEAKDDAKKGKQ